MPAKVHRCQKEVYPSLLKRFRERYKRSPSEKEKKKLEQSSWQICQSKFGGGE